MSKELLEKYTGGRAISSSALKEAKKSTRDFLYYYTKPKTTAKHFDFGNALELYMIDKVEFYNKVAIMDETKRPEPTKDYRTKTNQEWKAQFYAENENKYIIAATGPDSFEVIQELEKIAQMHPAYDLLLGKNYQDPFEWVCPITGFPRYARTDLFSAEDGIIIDIKTDGKDDFERACTNNDYFIQAFDQIEGALHSGKMSVVNEYYWFVFTKTAPYFVDVYKFDFEEALRVEESYYSTLRRLKSDLESDPEGIVWHQAPVAKIRIPNYYK